VRQQSRVKPAEMRAYVLRVELTPGPQRPPAFPLGLEELAPQVPPLIAPASLAIRQKPRDRGDRVRIKAGRGHRERDRDLSDVRLVEWIQDQLCHMVDCRR